MNNIPFSEGLKLMKRYWTGPILMDINRLNRCCGPEPEIKYRDSEVLWEKHITRFQKLIREGWYMPPLIVEHIDNIPSWANYI